MALAKMKPCCSQCGGSDMRLAQDRTAYSKASFDVETGKWVTEFMEVQDTDAEDSVRFFCTDCGTGHEVPEELQ